MRSPQGPGLRSTCEALPIGVERVLPSPEHAQPDVFLTQSLCGSAGAPRPADGGVDSLGWILVLKLKRFKMN